MGNMTIATLVLSEDGNFLFNFTGRGLKAALAHPSIVNVLALVGEAVSKDKPAASPAPTVAQPTANGEKVAEPAKSVAAYAIGDVVKVALDGTEYDFRLTAKQKRKGWWDGVFLVDNAEGEYPEGEFIGIVSQVGNAPTAPAKPGRRFQIGQVARVEFTDHEGTTGTYEAQVIGYNSDGYKVRFDNGYEVSVLEDVVAPIQVEDPKAAEKGAEVTEKPKRIISEEQKARMKAGREKAAKEKAKAAKAAEKSKGGKKKAAK